ncbi:MAG TPA: DUF3306 domain-containing protein [Burkholderiaceae bacterium]
MSRSDGDSGFLSRWSQRKALARQGVTPDESAPGADVATQVPAATAASVVGPAAASTSAALAQSAPEVATPPGGERPPPPTLADVAALTRESDYSRFVAPDVDGEVKNAALKKLFGDPRYNVMDGLDIYIDDYSKPDPLPASMIRQMAQAAFLGLVEAKPPAATTALTPAAADDAAVATPTAQAPKSAEVANSGSCHATPEPDENADLRLQPHDAAGCGGAEDSAAADGPSQL